jgi:hypothetical protein
VAERKWLPVKAGSFASGERDLLSLQLTVAPVIEDRSCFQNVGGDGSRRHRIASKSLGERLTQFGNSLSVTTGC